MRRESPLSFASLLLFIVACCATPATAAAQESAPPLASLDSAWASISRSYFDTVLVRGRWKQTYDSLRTSLADANDDGVRTGIRHLLTVPGKSHFSLIPGSAVPRRDAASSTPASSGSGRAAGTAGIDVRFVDGALLVSRVESGSAAEAAGIALGTKIVSVGDLRVDTVHARLTRAFRDEPRQVPMFVAAFTKNQLTGLVGDTVRISIEPPRGRATTKAFALGPMLGRSTQFGNLPPMVVRSTVDTVRVGPRRSPKAVPMLSFTMWLPILSQDIDRQLFALRDAPGLIIDLRGNPGGAVGMIGGVAGHFTDTATSLGTMFGRAATMNLRTNPRVVTNTGERKGIYQGPIALLVDEFTASSSEFFAAGLQGVGRVRIFGTTTAGQALPALMLRLPNGDVLMHPIADHVDAVGRRVEGVGIAPDEVTPLRRRDLVRGRDAALEAASAWLARTIR